jgi:hypothetical protein
MIQVFKGVTLSEGKGKKSLADEKLTVSHQPKRTDHFK